MKKYLNTYHKRVIALLVGFGIFLVVAYSFSFRRTFALNRETRDLKIKLAQSEQLPRRLMEARGEQARLEETFRQDAPEQLERQLLAQISEACAEHGVTLHAFEDPTESGDGAALVITYPLVLEGNFSRIVQTLAQLNDRLQGSRIMSVRYTQGEDRDTRNKYLRAHLYIQQVQMVSP